MTYSYGHGKTLVGPMTEAQFGYLIKLIGQAYAANPTVRAAELVAAAGYDKATASAKIELFKAAAKGAPAAPIAAAEAPSYYPPAGHYIVDGVHVHVKKGKYGGAATLTVGTSWKGSITHPKNNAYVAETFPNADTAYAAVVAFAKATGKCGKCHTKLTDPKSIAAGIGPVCAKKYGK